MLPEMSRSRPEREALVLATLRRALLPCPCLGCDRPIGGERPLLGLCVPCRGRLRRCAGRCAGCGRPIPGADPPAGFLCGGCRRRRPTYDELQPLYLYRPPLEAVVHQLKFGGLWYLGRHIASLLAERLSPRLRDTDLVVPVPLHWRRRLVRGYNQAEEIARPLARRLDKPFTRSLVRIRATVPQASLGREARLSNLEGAFAPRVRAEIAGRAVLLIDDVATTGRTLDAAAAALKSAGAARVTAAVLARAAPGELPARPTGKDLEDPGRA